MAELLKYDNLPHTPGTFGNYTVLSEGPNGIINSAYDTSSNSVVIIKDLIIPYNNKELFMNEIQVMMYLNQFNHPNIVRLIHAFKSSGFVGNVPQMRAHMVMEYYPFVLRALINSREADLSLPNIKCIMKQLLKAVRHMHEHNIFHRDLKPENIFITNNGILKVGDFGLSNFIKKKPDGRYEDTERNVITIWYRPPELLLGETSYGPEVDIWSLGCILAELFTGYAILQGKDDYSQLLCIATLCGELVPEMWPGVEKLSQYYQFFERLRHHYLGKRNVKTRLSIEFSNELGRDLVSLMIVPNPAGRLTAAQALQHSLFTTVPFPYSIINIPRIKYHRF